MSASHLIGGVREPGCVYTNSHQSFFKKLINFKLFFVCTM